MSPNHLNMTCTLIRKNFPVAVVEVQAASKDQASDTPLTGQPCQGGCFLLSVTPGAASPAPSGCAASSSAWAAPPSDPPSTSSERRSPSAHAVGLPLLCRASLTARLRRATHVGLFPSHHPSHQFVAAFACCYFVAESNVCRNMPCTMRHCMQQVSSLQVVKR